MDQNNPALNFTTSSEDDLLIDTDGSTTVDLDDDVEFLGARDLPEGIGNAQCNRTVHWSPVAVKEEVIEEEQPGFSGINTKSPTRPVMGLINSDHRLIIKNASLCRVSECETQFNKAMATCSMKDVKNSQSNGALHWSPDVVKEALDVVTGEEVQYNGINTDYSRHCLGDEIQPDDGKISCSIKVVENARSKRQANWYPDVKKKEVAGTVKNEEPESERNPRADGVARGLFGAFDCSSSDDEPLFMEDTYSSSNDESDESQTAEDMDNRCMKDVVTSHHNSELYCPLDVVKEELLDDPLKERTESNDIKLKASTGSLVHTETDLIGALDFGNHSSKIVRPVFEHDTVDAFADIRYRHIPAAEFVDDEAEYESPSEDFEEHKFDVASNDSGCVKQEPMNYLDGLRLTTNVHVDGVRKYDEDSNCDDKEYATCPAVVTILAQEKSKRRRICRKIEQSEIDALMRDSPIYAHDSYSSLGEKKSQMLMKDICVPIQDADVVSHLAYKKMVVSFAEKSTQSSSINKSAASCNIAELVAANLNDQKEEARLQKAVAELEADAAAAPDSMNILLHATSRKYCQQTVHGLSRSSLSGAFPHQLVLPPGCNAVPDTWFQYSPFEGIVLFDTRSSSVKRVAEDINHASNGSVNIDKEAKTSVIELIKRKLREGRRRACWTKTVRCKPIRPPMKIKLPNRLAQYAAERGAISAAMRRKESSWETINTCYDTHSRAKEFVQPSRCHIDLDTVKTWKKPTDGVVCQPKSDDLPQSSQADYSDNVEPIHYDQNSSQVLEITESAVADNHMVDYEQFARVNDDRTGYKGGMEPIYTSLPTQAFVMNELPLAADYQFSWSPEFSNHATDEIPFV